MEAEFGTDGYASTHAQFDEFLTRSGRFGGLELVHPATPTPISQDPDGKSASAPRPKIILVEELPNSFVSSPRALEQFRSSLLAYLSANAPSDIFSQRLETVTPLILVITEMHLNSSSSLSDTLTARRLLGTDILNHPSTGSIEFNPIATTYLLKALNLVIKKAGFTGRRRTPGPGILKKLAERGDVRSAIGALEFLCICSDDDEHWNEKVAARVRPKDKQVPPVSNTEIESLEMVTQRETSLGLFHAVGKVVYNKRMNQTQRFPQHSRQITSSPSTQGTESHSRISTLSSTKQVPTHPPSLPPSTKIMSPPAPVSPS